VLARPLPGVLIPPDELLAFGPGGAVGGRRGAAVQDAAVGRPRPRPFGSGLVLLGARSAAGGHVLTAGVDAGVDPAAAGRAAVGGQLCEGVQRPAVTPTADEIAVDLGQHGLGVDLSGLVDWVVPGQVQQRTVSGVSGVGELLADALTEFEEEVEFALRV